MSVAFPFGRACSALVWLAIGGGIAACGGIEYDSSQKHPLARNQKWDVSTLGNVDRLPSSMYGTTKVAFEASQNGTVYASGIFFEAGPHDHPLNEEYPERTWLLTDVLRLSRTPPRPLPTTALSVRNDAGVPIRWLSIWSDEMFLILQLPSHASVKFDNRRWGDGISFTVDGAFEDGTPLRSRENSFDPAVARLTIVASTRGVRVETR
jgi:hypothetical protein